MQSCYHASTSNFKISDFKFKFLCTLYHFWVIRIIFVCMNLLTPNKGEEALHKKLKKIAPGHLKKMRGSLSRPVLLKCSLFVRCIFFKSRQWLLGF